MTVVSYALGRPRIAAERGGDCRARDLAQGRNVLGGHRFAANDDCQITNGMLRLTVVNAGAPSLTVEAWRGRLTQLTDPAWLAMGTITLDSSTLFPLLTQVRIVRLNPEALTIRLVASIMGDAFVTLRRGERMIRVQHGAGAIPTTRRARWTGPPTLSGTTVIGRIEEPSPATGFANLYRFVTSNDAVSGNVSNFSLTATGVTTAEFGVGVGTNAVTDRPVDYHGQLGFVARRPRIVTRAT